jgi:hypothetical protein
MNEYSTVFSKLDVNLKSKKQNLDLLKYSLLKILD